MFVVLEGIDGSGKTSLAQRVAERCGGVAYATPPDKYKKLRKSVDVNSDLLSHYLFYREAMIEASLEIDAMLSEGKKVICDRYWLSTLVYHRAGNLVVDPADFSGLVRPDLSVLLLVSKAEQRRRTRERGKEIGNIDGFQTAITNLYLAALIESEQPFVTINTDYFGLERCADIVTAAMADSSNSIP